MDTMANQSCGTVPNTVISIPGHRPADIQLHNKCFVAPKGKKIPVRLPGKAVVTVDFHQAGTPQGKATERRIQGPRHEVARILDLAGYQIATTCDPNSVRFRIDRRGSERIKEHRKQREYERLLGETPEFDAELICVKDNDGDWIIVQKQVHEEHQRTVCDEYWATEAQARKYLEEHKERIHMDYVEQLFSRGECTQCSGIVLILGSYGPYNPAGMLWCADCLTDRNDEPTAAGIVR